MSPRLKVIVAMSGGVDSSVAAALLAKQGHDVVGVTLRLLPRGGEGFGCCGSPDDLLIAKRSAERAGVPHYVLDYSPDFETNVIDYFVNSYVSGETPNPCLACNRTIKFDKLERFARSLGATHLATGHYARLVSDAGAPHRLFEAVDESKDQSYVLYPLTQAKLGGTLFPVGGMPKTQIRDIARRLGLPNAEKKDSQEICFVPNRDYRGYVQKRLQERGEALPSTLQAGPIKDAGGNVVGEHSGVANFTVGQRKGLSLRSNIPMYVTRLDAATNTVVVGVDRDGVSAGLEAADVNWISGVAPEGPFEALVKIRYKHTPAAARVTPTANGFRADFAEPQPAVTPGQAAVIYRWDERVGAREVVAGGKITAALKAAP